MSEETRLIRFLLVEDDENHAELVRRNLDRDRIHNTLDHVMDGEQAIAFLRQEPPFEDAKRPDVILLDLKLPKKNGLEVLEEIKADDHLRSIPVVVVTTSEAEQDRQRAYELKANSYVTKPIDFEQFRQMVRDLSLYWGVWNKPPAGD